MSKLSGIPWGPDEEIAPREMGQGGVDVRLTSRRARQIFPWSIEAKNQEKWDIPGWIRQAKRNLKEGTYWLLFIKKNHHEEVVILDANKFFNIYGRLIVLERLFGKEDK